MNTKTTLYSLLALALLALSPVFAGERKFDQFLEHYDAIHTALAGDSMSDVADHAKALAKGARHFKQHGHKEHVGQGEHAGHGEHAKMASMGADDMTLLMARLASAADELADASDISAARAAFAKVSQAMIKWRASVDGDRPHVFFCPMIKQSWLQASDQAANPYFGKKMLKCGQIVEE